MAELGVFAKYWTPGKVKTRLAARLGSETAASLYHTFLQHLVGQLTGLPIRRTLVVSPAESVERFRRAFPDGWQVESQSPGNLGQRLSDYARRALVRNADSKVIVIGSDTPRLGPDRIQQAVQALDRVPVVLGPTDDGGYYLIGLKQVGPVFDNIPWSTPDVWSATVERLQADGIAWQTLDAMNDVDDVQDLDRLMQELAAASTEPDRALWMAVQDRLNEETR